MVVYLRATYLKFDFTLKFILIPPAYYLSSYIFTQQVSYVLDISTYVADTIHLGLENNTPKLAS